MGRGWRSCSGRGRSATWALRRPLAPRGFSDRAVYRAIERGDLSASLVCSRLRIYPDDFLSWMEGERAARRYRPRVDAAPNVPAINGHAVCSQSLTRPREHRAAGAAGRSGLACALA